MPKSKAMIRTALQNDWQFRQVGNRDWHQAWVPGWIYADLFRNGLIPDLFSEPLEWVDEADWEYRAVFDWNSISRDSRKVLRFEKLDTFASVTLNGQPLGQSSNAFLPVEFEVGSYLQTGHNELRIEFQSAAMLGRELRQAYLKAEGLPDDIACFDERAFVRRPQFSFGWDFSPRLIGCGVLGPVQLLEFESRILRIDPQVAFRGDGSVEINISMDAQGSPETELFLESDPSRVFDHSIVLPKGTYQRWPHAVERVGVMVKGSDVVTFTSLPLRTIELEQVRDVVGESFRFVLSGEPIVVMGANVVPQFPPFDRTIGPLDTYSSLKDLPKSFNMIRVWGGGDYLSEETLNHLDNQGILVWHDFPFACSYIPDDPEFAKTIEQEATYHVQRMRAHPCMALWCGNNENLMMHQGRWGGEKNIAKRFYGEEIYERTLRQVVTTYAPEIPYIPTSPTGSHANPQTTIGPNGETTGTSNGETSGDTHYWDVWHGRGDWIHYQDCNARFVSEFGFPSWSHDGATLNRTGRSDEYFLSLLAEHYPSPRNSFELRLFSQLNQRDAMRFALIKMLSKASCDGALLWQWNDCAPGLTWAWTEHDGTPKIVRQWFEISSSGGAWQLGDETYAFAVDRKEAVTRELWRRGESKPLQVEQATIESEPRRVTRVAFSEFDFSTPDYVVLKFGDQVTDAIGRKQRQELEPALIFVEKTEDGFQISSPQLIIDACVCDPDWHWMHLIPGSPVTLSQRPQQIYSLFGEHPLVQS